MTRQIVLDVETTGLYAAKGDRIVEIGLVEIIDRHITGKEKNFYVNPERPCSQESINIHGLTDEFLFKQPKFHEIVNDVIDFIHGDQLIIHNAPFDLSFFEFEFKLLHKKSFSLYYSDVFDTLKYARLQFPGKRSSLDALCAMFQISSAHRVTHGALLDAKLLAEVYLCLTRGQESLSLDIAPVSSLGHSLVPKVDSQRKKDILNDKILSSFVDKNELLAHQAILDAISIENKEPCIWSL